MSLAKLIAWETLNGTVVTHHSFIDNIKRQSVLWYFKATVDDKTIEFNYRKYNNRYVLVRDASVITAVQYANGNIKTHTLRCSTVKKLKEVLYEV